MGVAIMNNLEKSPSFWGIPEKPFFFLFCVTETIHKMHVQQEQYITINKKQSQNFTSMTSQIMELVN